MTQEQFLAATREAREISFSANASISDRTIDATWIATALQDHGSAIILENAVIAGNIVLQSTTVVSRFLLKRCELQSIIAEYCSFNEWFALIDSRAERIGCRGSRFLSAMWLRGTSATTLDLGYATIGADLDMDQCTVASRTYLVGIRVSNNLHARSSRLDSINLSLAHVGGQVDLMGIHVAKEATFVDGTFGGFIAPNAHFGGHLQFDRAQIDASLTLRESTFGAGADFAGTSIRGQFVLNGCAFGGTTHLDGVSCDDFFAVSCDFADDASFIGSRFFSVTLDDSHFHARLEMHETTVAVGTSFRDVKFDRDARLERMSIGSTMRFTSTTEKGCSFAGLVSLSGCKVGAQLLFESVVFDGAVVLESVNVGSDLFLDKCDIRGDLKLVGAKIGGNCDLTGTHFRAQVDLTNTSINEHTLFFRASFEQSPDLIRTQVGSSLNFSGARLARGANLDYATVQGRTIFLGAQVDGTLSARMADLKTLVFDSSVDPGETNTWRFRETTLDLSGLRYDRIEVQWQPFIANLAKSSGGKDRQPFLMLERSLRGMGRDDWADTVYYQGRAQAIRVYKRLSGKRFGDFLNRWISGYGVRPARLAGWVAVLLIASTSLFLVPGVARPSSVEAKAYRCNRTPAVAQAFGLGVSSLTSGGTKEVDGWVMSNCPLTKLHIKPFSIMGALRVLGTILIPFLIAQLTGLWRYPGGR